MKPEAETALALMTAELLELHNRMGKEFSGGRTLDDDTAGQIMLAMASAHIAAATSLATTVLGPQGAAQLLCGEADRLATKDKP